MLSPLHIGCWRLKLPDNDDFWNVVDACSVLLVSLTHYLHRVLYISRGPGRESGELDAALGTRGGRCRRLKKGKRGGGGL
jgi:hypothetical protein